MAFKKLKDKLNNDGLKGFEDPISTKDDKLTEKMYSHKPKLITKPEKANFKKLTGYFNSFKK